MTPSARVSAINIVGDLLRKVGVSDIRIIKTLIKAMIVLVVTIITFEYIT